MSYYNQQQLSIGVLPPQGYPPEKYPKDAYLPQGYPLAGYPDTLHRTLRRPPAVNQPAFRHGRMIGDVCENYSGISPDENLAALCCGCLLDACF